MNEDLLELTGLVLSSSPIGEYDRRVVLLTRERGRIACFARGARRPGSPVMAASLPFCFGTYRVREGRSANVLVEARLHTFFEKLRSDMERTCYASYLAEVLRYITRENNDEAALLLLAFQSFRALESGRIPCRLVRAVFEIRMLRIEGEFLPPQETDGFSPAALQAVAHITKAPIRTLYTFAVNDAVLEQLEHIAEVSMERSLHHRFESLEILKALML
ncbi:MAG: DNA repair protein RecO [Eubacteriales bacterium]|nr:DNA repair protein RecO [Sarcina sp.]MDO4418210.1 DNA repair protein RecO [Eubacteriales bacterium]